MDVAFLLMNPALQFMLVLMMILFSSVIFTPLAHTFIHDAASVMGNLFRLLMPTGLFKLLNLLSALHCPMPEVILFMVGAPITSFMTFIMIAPDLILHYAQLLHGILLGELACLYSTPDLLLNSPEFLHSWVMVILFLSLVAPDLSLDGAEFLHGILLGELAGLNGGLQLLFSCMVFLHSGIIMFLFPLQFLLEALKPFECILPGYFSGLDGGLQLPFRCVVSCFR